ncbi:MAG TPA: tRNA lysidine(34) synthetase TilS, partial [Cyclobacteriaceae bacterium]|nr:tRNA lysidine(34) synthetase TilS [Cyclobacteriaceae bacterium]
YAFVATAHHLNDSLETLLLNLAKGTGIDGVAGIPVKHQQFVRPMLFASRSQIEEYARVESLEWREDLSNATDDYQRNVIRHHVVPVLKEINPNLEDTFSDTSLRLRASRDFVREYLKAFNIRNMYYDGRHVLIRREELRNNRFGSVILWELLKDLGFNFDQCREIVEKDHQSGSLFVSATHQLVVSRDEFILSKPGGKSAAVVEIPEGAKRANLEGKSLILEVRDHGEVTPTRNQAIATMDLDKLVFPLVWRHWKDGDRFIPLGMKNHKKLSDFLVDEKFSLPDKDQVTVIESAGRIVWVVGQRLSEEVKVTGSTARVLIIRMDR